jgi:hypothetical protein
MLGDRVATALAAVGITEQRVQAWVGKPCGCKERKEKLNQLGAWAARVIAGKVEKAKEYLDRIIET